MPPCTAHDVNTPASVPRLHALSQRCTLSIQTAGAATARRRRTCLAAGSRAAARASHPAPWPERTPPVAAPSHRRTPRCTPTTRPPAAVRGQATQREQQHMADAHARALEARWLPRVMTCAQLTGAAALVLLRAAGACESTARIPELRSDKPTNKLTIAAAQQTVGTSTAGPAPHLEAVRRKADRRRCGPRARESHRPGHSPHFPGWPVRVAQRQGHSPTRRSAWPSRVVGRSRGCGERRRCGAVVGAQRRQRVAGGRGGRRRRGERWAPKAEALGAALAWAGLQPGTQAGGFGGQVGAGQRVVVGAQREQRGLQPRIHIEQPGGDGVEWMSWSGMDKKGCVECPGPLPFAQAMSAERTGVTHVTLSRPPAKPPAPAPLPPPSSAQKSRPGRAGWQPTLGHSQPPPPSTQAARRGPSRTRTSWKVRACARSRGDNIIKV